MIALEMAQGTPDWAAARLGIPTCSRFSDILTPAKLEYSKSAGKYIADLLTEWALGYPVIRGGGSGPMERGTGMEGEARLWYEMQRGVDTVRCGFVLRDDRRAGGSPDSLVGEDGIVEIKCPMAHIHMGYLLAGRDLPYAAQVQGYLHVTGREWADVLSYHPTLPKHLVRVHRDDAFQAALTAALGRFLAELDEAKEKLRALGVRPAPPFTRQADPAAWEEIEERSYLLDSLQASIAAGGSC